MGLAVLLEVSDAKENIHFLVDCVHLLLGIILVHSGLGCCFGTQGKLIEITNLHVSLSQTLDA